MAFLKAISRQKKDFDLFTQAETMSDTTIGHLQYKFSIIKAATDDFSGEKKIGQGGFGPVYKGTLRNGEEIAVKRLLNNSGQGQVEFKNEVLLVAKLQHRNLVRLLGFSLKGSESLLIYEFLPNGSLDRFIFDETRRSLLDWDRRYKIIGGVARGLLYLHEDSHFRIIHRDIKPSNVLLDAKMNPKIGDFGLSRLFNEETHVSTSRVVGTYGYMAPEYAINGKFSVKVDVFSFGVLVLEIIAGQRNQSFWNRENIEDALFHKREGESFLGYAWKCWWDGTASDMIDPILRTSSGSVRDIIRIIHIALLCVQENVDDRPTMASVVIMLNSSSLTLPVPSEPAYTYHTYGTCGGESEAPPLAGTSGGQSEYFKWKVSGLRKFSFYDIQEATNHFDESKAIGRGGFGNVYKGLIHDGNTTTVVAVKRLKPESRQGLAEFQTEIKMLSGFQHCHLVSLVGYCDDSSEMILVYEYMPHGALADHLYKNADSALPWNLRLKICIGAARGLDYLHIGILYKIIHCDIKSANILLDENWAAKISDLGLSKVEPMNRPCSEVITEHVTGTRGYIDPRYRKFHKLSVKSDVYAFGVVLLEVLTGTRAGGGGLIPEDKDLADWTKKHLREQTLYQITDRRVRCEVSPTCLVTFANIAIKSLHSDPKKRPTMSEVVANLEFALAYQEGTNPSSSIIDEELHQHFNAVREVDE